MSQNFQVQIVSAWEKAIKLLRFCWQYIQFFLKNIAISPKMARTYAVTMFLEKYTKQWYVNDNSNIGVEVETRNIFSTG